MNRENILEFIEVFKKNLDSLSHLKKSDSEAIEKNLKKPRR